MLTVYRLEDIEGIGPYRNDRLKLKPKYREMIREHSGYNGRDDYPVIYEDILHGRARMTEEHLCGFDSLEKLKKWFGRYLKYLLKNGFRVVECKVFKTAVLYSQSKRQLAFKLKRAEHKRCIIITKWNFK